MQRTGTIEGEKHILVVDDEAAIADGIARALRDAGYSVETAPTASLALAALQARPAKLVILDIGLPGQNGLELLQQLREEDHDLAVLMLSSFDDMEDRVKGLNTGADDYMGKPFALPELIARVRALLRRMLPTITAEGGVLQVGDLSLNLKTRDAHRGDVALNLTAREFDLLVCLAEQKGSVMTREMLARKVWGEIQRSTPIANVIDVQIGRLRKKIDDPFQSRLLHTVRGLGFILREEQP